MLNEIQCKPACCLLPRKQVEGNDGKTYRRKQWKFFMKLHTCQLGLCLSLQGHFFWLWNAEGRDEAPESETVPKHLLIELWLPSYQGVSSRVCFNLMLCTVWFRFLPDLTIIVSFVVKIYFL